VHILQLLDLLATWHTPDTHCLSYKKQNRQVRGKTSGDKVIIFSTSC